MSYHYFKFREIIPASQIQKMYDLERTAKVFKRNFPNLAEIYKNIEHE